MAMVHHHTRSQKMPHMRLDLRHNCTAQTRNCGSNYLIPCNCRNQVKAKVMVMELELEKELDYHHNCTKLTGNLVGCNRNWPGTKNRLLAY